MQSHRAFTLTVGFNLAVLYLTNIIDCQVQLWTVLDSEVKTINKKHHRYHLECTYYLPGTNAYALLINNLIDPVWKVRFIQIKRLAQGHCPRERQREWEKFYLSPAQAVY